MKYRKFGKQEFQTSIIGMGTMRLPLIQGKTQTDVDEERAIRLIRQAIDGGINYIDTAYPYHGGKSEEIVGRALKEGYRNQVTLVTKSPVWLVERYEDFEKYLDQQLERLQTDHIDLYLLHALNLKEWTRIEALGALQFLEAEKRKGRIRLAGFSFHDKHEAYTQILNAHPWDAVLLQMNYMDVQEQATLEGLKQAGALGIPVVVMEPLKGGLLADPPEEVTQLMKARRPDWKAVEWSFRWLAHLPEVKVILSGMSDETQVAENLAFGDVLEADAFTEADFEAIGEVKAVYDGRIQVGCTQCQYCMPCPSGVDIPRTFRLYNLGSVFNSQKASQNAYLNAMKPENRASACTGCRQCEASCPQHLPISERLAEADRYLTNA